MSASSPLHRPRRSLNAGLRRFAEIFFVLGSLVFGLLLFDRVDTLLASFNSIILVCFLAWLLAFIVTPLVEGVSHRLRVGRLAAIAIVYVLITAGISTLVFGVASIGAAEITDFLGQTGALTARLSNTLTDIQAALHLNPSVIDLPAVLDRGLSTTLPQVAASWADQFQAVAGATIILLGNLFIVLVLSLYMVIDAQGLLARLNRVVPNQYADELELVERTVSRAFGGFLRTQFILVLIQVILTVSVGLAFGLPYLFLTGIVSAMAMFIPFFGPPIALLPPILVAAGFRSEVFWPVALILLGAQTILVNFAQPRLMHRSVGMHPILVIIALLVGAQVAGLWGAIFGIPIAAVGSILVSYFLDLRVIAENAGTDLETISTQLLAAEGKGSPAESANRAAKRTTAVQVEARSETDQP
jgi:predicted PurR-regulated permease PerM